MITERKPEDLSNEELIAAAKPLEDKGFEFGLNAEEFARYNALSAEGMYRAVHAVSMSVMADFLFGE